MGWIKLHKKILNWDWYSDSNTKDVFLHLLLTANHRPRRYKGITIERGQVLFGRKTVAEKLGISEQNVRTAISHLQSTKEITITSTKTYSIATIRNYDVYQPLADEANQEDNQDATENLTNDQPRANQELTTPKNIRSKEEVKKVENSPIGECEQPQLKKRNRMQEIIETWEAPDAVKAELWKFISMRGQMKKAFPVASIPNLLEQLAGMGWDTATATLKHTVANGYTGLVTPKDVKQDGKPILSAGYQDTRTKDYTEGL